MRVLLVLLLVGCWRQPAQRTQPELSFVARVNAIDELQRRTNSLAPKLDVTEQRIHGLASEAERAALHDDLNALEQETAQLSRMARDARERGDDPLVIARIERKLQYAVLGIGQLREDLHHARTREEQEAFEELKKKVEGTLDHLEIEIRGPGRLNQVPEILVPRRAPTP